MDNLSNKLVRLAKQVQSVEFETQEQLKQYLKEHPDSDKTRHTVKKTKKTVKQNISDAKQKAKNKFEQAKQKITDIKEDPKAHAKQMNKFVQGKIKNWSTENKEFFNGGELSDSKERRSLGKMAKAKGMGVTKVVKQEVGKWKDAASGIKSVVRGKGATSEQKDALKTVSKKVAATISLMAVTGGAGIAAKPLAVLAKHLGLHLFSSMAKSGVLRAGLFASIRVAELEMTDDEALELFIEEVMNMMVTAPISPKLWAKAIEVSDYDFTK